MTTAANDPAVSRRLAAILIADVVGYTRLMEHDEAGTHMRLKEIRKHVVDCRIAAHGGRIIHTAGDGMLVEFGSATAALRCAIETQREMGTRNLYLAPEARIDFRIGINLGDIIIDGDDIAGEGVNVAARLETLAEPGGICISATVREHAHEDFGVGFVDIGEQQVKNIVRPIRVYRVTLGQNEKAAGAAGAGRAKRTAEWRWWTVGVALLGAVGVGAWLLPQLSPPPPGLAAMPPALSIAILPFAAPSGTEDDRQFADGLTRDVAAGLGAWHRATVAAHAHVANLQPKNADVRALGHELNVRYVLEGEVRRDGNEFVVAAQLVQTATGTQVWSDRLRFDSLQPGPGKPVPRVQLTRRLRVALKSAELRRASAAASGATAMDMVLRGDSILDSARTSKDALAARPLFLEALRLDPNFVPALLSLRDWYDADLEENEAPDRAANVKEIDRLSSLAIVLDPSEARAWIGRSEALQWLGRWEEALAAAERAITLDPSERGGQLMRAWILIRTARPKEALSAIDLAKAIDPLDPAGPDHYACKAKLFLGRYGEAVADCERAAAEINNWTNHLYLCAAYAMHGDDAKASASRVALLKEQLRFTVARYREMYAASPPAFFELVDKHLAPGLRKAGIPEK